MVTAARRAFLSSSSNMASRKSKVAKVDFSAEAILGEIGESERLLKSVSDFRSELSLGKVSRLLRTFPKKVDFDCLLALLLGFDVVMWTMISLKHGPKVLDRYKNTRCRVIFAIVNCLCPQRGLTVEMMEDIVSFLEEFKFSFYGRLHLSISGSTTNSERDW